MIMNQKRLKCEVSLNRNESLPHVHVHFLDEVRRFHVQSTGIERYAIADLLSLINITETTIINRYKGCTRPTGFSLSFPAPRYLRMTRRGGTVAPCPTATSKFNPFSNLQHLF